MNTPYAQQLASLFRTLSTAINTADVFSICNVARKITLFELETLLTTRWTVYCDALKPELTWQQRLFFWKKPQAIDTELLRDVLLAWFWAFKIIDARIEGRLPAWEGIRIVREQTKS
ncbi:MAG: hypothetical protein WCK96_07850 [Methylococcales bacterium]